VFSSRDPAVVAGWWHRRPHSVLLATGNAYDVLEVPAHLGATRGLAKIRGPVACTATGRYMILIGPGAVLRPELAALPDVVLHGQGSWIPAPPSDAPEGRVRWLISPEEVDWQIPHSGAVQAELIRALPRLRAATGPRHLRLDQAA
jgi:hypothetical protein